MLTLIAAIDQHNGIGKNNQLLCHLPADLKHFKQKTTGHCVLMGRKTFESIGKPLPNRTTIIISRNNNFKAPEGCLVAKSLQEAITLASFDPTPFIIGGAEIYKKAMPFAKQLEITHIHHTFEADAFFPKIDITVWEETARESHFADEKNKYDYSFVTYQQK